MPLNQTKDHKVILKKEFVQLLPLPLKTFFFSSGVY